jgi:beta-glucosidase
MIRKLIGFLLLGGFILAGSACTTEVWKDNSYSPEERAADLLSKLTLEEKVLLMVDRNAPIERLGIQEYNWWNEALHGVARAGRATVFPQPVGMAASFDKDMVLDIFSVVSDEARAKHHYFKSRGEFGRYQGLTMWTPTINVFRDPRWGRGMEAYGEDPFMNGVLGTAVVHGLQGKRGEGYDKLHACAKHFAVHSGPEWNRHSFDANNIKPRDLHETYLPAFKKLVIDGDVRMVMCAYNRFEGEPCCSNNELMIDILRNEWGFDGVVVSDCWAIYDFYNKEAHGTHPDAESASSDAVRAGTDLNCGESYPSLVNAVAQGLISEEELDVSVLRLLKARFALGEMDDDKKVKWSKIPHSVVSSPEHATMALEAARKSMTLLRNENGALPLKRGGLTIAVMGPNANDSLMQLGNYNGTPASTTTILQGISKALGSDDRLIYEQGTEWVGDRIFSSVFEHCISEAGQGFTAHYWNNPDRKGTPDVVTQVNTPFHFHTGGATVFAPGVKLTNFSARYTSTYHAERNGEIFFHFYVNGITRLLVDGEPVFEYRSNHGGRKHEYKMNVEAGQAYDIELEYAHFMSEAELDFNIGYMAKVDLPASVARVADADVIVFVSGISPFLEGEEMGVDLPGFTGGDRTDIALPAIQRELLSALHKAGKKIILVNCSGSAIGFDEELEYCSAILQAWYPGQAGGTAVAEVLFGDYNPAGRLPVTFYKNVEQLPDFEDYNMTNRTYRYFKGEPLFHFGYGLSYTTFTYEAPRLSSETVAIKDEATLTVSVTNNGNYDGEEVVQLYLQKPDDVEGPLLTLRGFKRVFIAKGETVEVKFQLTQEVLEWWNAGAQRMTALAGDYRLLVGSSSRQEDLQAVPLTIVQ